MVASAVVYVGLIDPATLEAQACNEAIALATGLHLNLICIAMDCAEVVANIANSAPCRYAMILSDINHQRQSFRDFKIIHEKREHNIEAHSLAKAASSLSIRRHVWLAVLPDIICIPLNIAT